MARARLTRRRATITLHWTVLILLMLMVSEGGRFAVVLWAFVLACLGFAALGLVAGLMTRPGPKLTGLARAVHPWQHRAMYVLMAGTALVTGADALGLPVLIRPGMAQALLLFAMMQHAVYHLRCHTALRDGALRIITPRALHKHL